MHSLLRSSLRLGVLCLRYWGHYRASSGGEEGKGWGQRSIGYAQVCEVKGSACEYSLSGSIFWSLRGVAPLITMFGLNAHMRGGCLTFLQVYDTSKCRVSYAFVGFVNSFILVYCLAHRLLV